MKISIESGQLEQEAKQALTRLNASRKSLPAKQDYRIMSHSRDAYRPPHFVRNAATGNQYDDLCNILQQLWEANEEHAGESCVELTAYFTLTAPHAELEDRIMSWCGAYVAERLIGIDCRDLRAQRRNQGQRVGAAAYQESEAPPRLLRQWHHGMWE